VTTTRKAAAEAPSKAIITGEHFVVHGSRALAAAMGKKVRVEVSGASALTIEGSNRPAQEHNLDLRPVRSVVNALASEYSFRPNLRLDIRSDIPDSAGLGSSAATMVAVAAAVAKSKSIGLTADEIVRFATIGEREVHGHPSGIDVTTCAYGGVILYRIGARPKRVEISGVAAGRDAAPTPTATSRTVGGKKRKLLIAHSGIRRSTGRMINRVSDMKTKRPDLFQSLAESIDEVSLMAASRLSLGDMEGLGRLLTLNHAALSFVGASNDQLDDLVDTLVSLGCLGAKLTGAGGGGSVLGIAPEKRGKSIISQLERRGFEAFEAEIPVGGVRSWWLEQ
jgi:mevalonate kinase